MQTIAVLVIGLIIGALVIYGLVTGFRGQIPGTDVQLPEVSQTPAEPGQTIPQAEEDLQRRLFEEGVTTTATVDQVYPGIGFILEDVSGERLFVHWAGTAPQEGGEISVRGTVSRLTGQEEFRNDPQFTSELDNFLQDQTIYIEAQTVSPSQTPTP